MKRYCITGGIGAGKSYVCDIMRKHYGLQVYDCDSAAKQLMNSSAEIRTALVRLIGEQAYVDGKLNKAAVANFLLASEQNKQAVNAIVHPAVIRDFYNSGLQWMESAILYEANLQHTVDRVLVVTAPQEVRLQRVMLRDGISRKKAMEWICKQMPQEETARRADFVIVNDGERDIITQLEKIIKNVE